MSGQDWAVIEDIDEDTWKALSEATRRAIFLLRELREGEVRGDVPSGAGL